MLDNLNPLTNQFQLLAVETQKWKKREAWTVEKAGWEGEASVTF